MQAPKGLGWCPRMNPFDKNRYLGDGREIIKFQISALLHELARYYIYATSFGETTETTYAEMRSAGA